MQKVTTICSLYSYLTTCLFTGIRLHQPTPLLPPCIWKTKEVKKPVKHIICKGQPSTSDQIKSILRSATTRVSIFRGSLLICRPGLAANAIQLNFVKKNSLTGLEARSMTVLSWGRILFTFVHSGNSLLSDSDH